MKMECKTHDVSQEWLQENGGMEEGIKGNGRSNKEVDPGGGLFSALNAMVAGHSGRRSDCFSCTVYLV